VPLRFLFLLARRTRLALFCVDVGEPHQGDIARVSGLKVDGHFVIKLQDRKETAPTLPPTGVQASAAAVGPAGVGRRTATRPKVPRRATLSRWLQDSQYHCPLAVLGPHDQVDQ
jgi:hypothetical protein